jgi:hypothetical protein
MTSPSRSLGGRAVEWALLGLLVLMTVAAILVAPLELAKAFGSCAGAIALVLLALSLIAHVRWRLRVRRLRTMPTATIEQVLRDALDGYVRSLGVTLAGARLLQLVDTRDWATLEREWRELEHAVVVVAATFDPRDGASAAHDCRWLREAVGQLLRRGPGAG